MSGRGARPALLAAALLAVGCGASESEPAGDAGEPETALTVTFHEQGPSGDPVTWELRCDPPGGDHPDPAGACAAVAEADEDAFAPVPPGVACTEIYGGPQTARVEGVVRGERVEGDFKRTNGCEIARWDALHPLLPAAGV